LPVKQTHIGPKYCPYCWSGREPLTEQERGRWPEDAFYSCGTFYGVDPRYPFGWRQGVLCQCREPFRFFKPWYWAAKLRGVIL
jgi:hypothetical protein